MHLLARFLLFVLLVSHLTSIAWCGTFSASSRQEAMSMKRKVRASQFLHRATFGPTIEAIDELAARMQQVGERRACEEWIDEQFSLPASLHQPLAEAMIADDGFTTTRDDVWIQRYRYHAWWHQTLTSEDQLRQRVTWALIQILVTSENGDGFDDPGPGNLTGKGRWLGPTHYYDMLLQHVFTNYRELLQRVTYHPVMGIYLSHMRNRKASGTRFPDENYAREIMQLFSIGLYQLHPDGRYKTTANGELIPTYDNETIKELARIFTGLTFKPTSPSNFFWSGNEFLFPMEMYSPEHDSEPKTIFGTVIDEADGNAEVNGALDVLFAHDNVAPFISHRLIQRLVKSNPSRAYLRRVSRVFNDNGQGVKGDMKAVVKAILLDPEAWHSIRVRTLRSPDRVVVSTRGTEYSRLREPVIAYASLLRAVHAKSDYRTGRMMVLPQDWNWLQEPYKQPSVFSFFLPEFQPPGDLIGFQPSARIPNGSLVAPEFQQKTAVTSNRLINRYIWDISSQRARFTASGSSYNLECNLNFDLSREKQLATNDADMPRLLDLYDLVFCCGTMPQDFKDRIVQVVNTETQWMKTNTTWRPEMENFRATCALIAVATSPFAAVAE